LIALIIPRHVAHQYRQDPTCRFSVLHLALSVEHRDTRAGTLLRHIDAVLLGFGGIALTKQASDKVLLFDLHARVDVKVTHVEVTRGAIAIVDGEPGRIDGHTHATPGTVK